MPIGTIINCTAVFAGGLLGAVLHQRFPEPLKQYLPDAFGLCAILMGINLMSQVKNLPAVVLALVFGTAIGELLHMEHSLVAGLKFLGQKVPLVLDSGKIDVLISVIILFCFSGTGIFGTMNEALSGDHTLLLAKSILDFFTAIIFGTVIGYAIAFIAIPQFIIGLLLFVCAAYLLPHVTVNMISDFKACGGIITLAAGLKIAKIKNFRIFNMLLSLVLVLPISLIWNSCF